MAATLLLLCCFCAGRFLSFTEYTYTSLLFLYFLVGGLKLTIFFTGVSGPWGDIPSHFRSLAYWSSFLSTYQQRSDANDTIGSAKSGCNLFWVFAPSTSGEREPARGATCLDEMRLFVFVFLCSIGQQSLWVSCVCFVHVEVFFYFVRLISLFLVFWHGRMKCKMAGPVLPDIEGEEWNHWDSPYLLSGLMVVVL
ncbi:hypothetical protein BD289DRAFT_28802 [Coniella lustricola]|uniref:Uncharacterized protein n=1 Tax=Coniella lustricola TaxID=2025994 RepID=A0A2T3AJ91_9PEZI|nr:hypothetical protein BD289DRAFT_28802 [Coniella lustricola]